MLRTPTLTWQSLWRDEVDAIRFSSWRLQDMIAGLTQKGHNGPLFFLLLRPWRHLSGDSEFALRYPSAWLGVLLVPLGFVLARHLGFSRRVGLLLSLLLATSPYLVWYGQEAKMYTLLTALVILAVITYLKALTGAGRYWWVIFVLLTSLTFYLHILSPLMLIVYGFIAMLYQVYWREQWRAWSASMACLTLPYLPLLFWQVSFLVDGAGRGHPFYPLAKEFSILLQLYSGGLFRFVGFTASLLFIFLFLCGLFLINRPLAPDWPGVLGIRAGQFPLTGPGWAKLASSSEAVVLKNRLLLAAWSLLPPLTVYLISLRVPIFEDRYLIYITPAFYLLIGLGIVSLRRYARWLAGLCLGLILIINLTGVWLQQRGPVKADFRAAAAYLANQPQLPTTIMIQMPYLKHTFNYYYPHNYTFVEGLWTNDNKSQATVDTEMKRLTAELTDLWLVVSEGETWDNRQMVQSWLERHANLVAKAQFTRVDVYYYQLRPGAIEVQSNVAPGSVPDAR